MKEILKKIFNSLGYKVSKKQGNPFFDSDDYFVVMKHLLEGTDKGIFFDVGANSGQTTEKLISMFPKGEVYAFEPGPAYPELVSNYKTNPQVTIEKQGLGSKREIKNFFYNSLTDMSSFLPLGEDGWGEVIKEVALEINTVDNYCTGKNITSIDILKSDTQGFDLEVLKGANNMLDYTRFVILEINFTNVYKGLPSFSEIFQYLSDKGFKLVKFYDIRYHANFIAYADVLFVNESLHANT